MSKTNLLASVITALFPKSNKAISEKLSTEEYNEFSEDATELNSRLDAQKTGNEKVVADLEAAQKQLSEATTKLEAAQKQLTEKGTELTAVTAERDKYKAYYDKATGKGKAEANEDENGRNQRQLAGYNQHAQQVYQKLHSSK